jgi:hypothetical protein
MALLRGDRSHYADLGGAVAALALAAAAMRDWWHRYSRPLRRAPA